MPRSLLVLLGCFLLSNAGACSQQAEPANLAEGRELFHQLSPASTPDPAADEIVFRRNAVAERKHQDLARDLATLEQTAPDLNSTLDDPIGDDLLRLVFISCHPILSTESRANLLYKLGRHHEARTQFELAASRQTPPR